MAARRGSRGSRTGTFFVLMGILGVLTATFVAGIWTGRNWPVLFGHANAPAAEPAPPTRRGAAERPRPADALPALTFYDELKAPLTAPPPPPPRAKAPKPVEPARRETAPETPPPLTSSEVAAPRPEPAAAVEAPPASEASARFTVQVAAYNLRPPADVLRSTLASAGHEARVVEAVTPGGVRYRVQVGAFATRQAAQDAAARLTAERALPTFVTTR